MKRFLTFVLLLSLVFSFSAFAEFENRPVNDNAELLTQAQYRDISGRLSDLRQKYGFDVAVYTEDEMSGISAESTADDIYDYGGYGYGEDFSGIMLYISADERQYHITTSGYGIYAFNDNGLVYLEDAVKSHLKADDYYSAMSEYVRVCDELLAMAKDGSPYNEKQRKASHYIVIICLALLIPFIVAKVKTGKKLAGMKTAVMQNKADNCMKDGSMRLDVSRDLFLFSNVTKTPKAKSGDGSSTHTSLSGRTHGGRGGSF